MFSERNQHAEAAQGKHPPALSSVFDRLLLFGLILPTFCLILVGGAVHVYFLKKGIQDHQVQLARSVASDVQTYLVGASRVLTALADFSAGASMDEIDRYMESVWQEYRFFETLYLIGPSREVLHTVPPATAGLDIPGLDLYEPESPGDTIKVSLPFISSRTGNPTVHVARRVSTGGMVVGDLNLELLQDIVNQLEDASKSHRALVADAFGHLLAHPDAHPGGSPYGEGPLSALDPSAGDGQTVTYREGDQWKQGTLVRVPGLNWQVIVYSSMAELFGPLFATGGGVLALLAAYIGFACTITRRIHRKILEPLSLLAARTQAVIRGETGLSEERLPESFLELSELVNHFEEMRQTIQDREEVLRANSALFYGIVQNSTDIVMILEEDGEIRFMSPAVERILGHPAEQMVGTKIKEWISREDLKWAVPYFKERRGRQGIHGPVDIRFRHRSGSWISLECIANNLLENHVIRGVVIHARDISERKRLEEEKADLLRTLEEKVRKRTHELETLFDYSKKVSFGLNEEDFASLTYQFLHRVVPLDVFALSVHQDGCRRVFVPNLERSSPAVLDKIARHLSRESESGAPSRGLEFRDIGAGSSLEEPRPTVRDLVVVWQIPLEVDRKGLGALLVGRETSDSFTEDEQRFLSMMGHQAAESLHRFLSLRDAENRRMENLLENLPQGVMLIDREGHVKISNDRARRLMVDLDLGSGKIERIGDVALKDLVSRRVCTFPVDISPDGKRHYEIQVNPMQGTASEHCVLTLQDVTAERSIQSQIQQQDRLAAVGQLAAGIAHDFNNLLMGMMMQAQLLQMKWKDESWVSGLEVIVHQGQRAAHLIQQILDFSRKSISRRGRLDLAPLLKETVKILRRTIEEHVETVLRIDAGDALVEADPTQIQQIVTNMAVNARDAMPEGGTFAIRLSRLELGPEDVPPYPDMPPGQWVVMTFSDTGSGIAPEHLPHVFEPFFTTKEVGKGTGLGLAQAYGIIKQHGGYIQAASTPGEGTVFSVYLPALDAAEETVAASPPAESSICRAHGETILLAEDELSVLQIAKDMLEFLGYQVIPASNGREALRLYERHFQDIDLVITDLVMPVMGGKELTAFLRRKNPRVKVLVVTGYPLKEDAGELLSGENIAWMQKPFELRHLSRAVREILDGDAMEPVCEPTERRVL